MATSSLNVFQTMSFAVLLRLAPLLTTTAALQFGHDMYLFNGALLHPDIYPKAQGIIRQYFNAWFGRGTFWIFVLYPVSLVTSFINARSLSAAGVVGASRYYWAGFAFVLGHFAFAPYVVGTANRLLDEKATEPTNELLRQWLKRHARRSVIVDFPAWVMSLMAVAAWCAAGSPA